MLQRVRYQAGHGTAQGTVEDKVGTASVQLQQGWSEFTHLGQKDKEIASLQYTLFRVCTGSEEYGPFVKKQIIFSHGFVET